MAKWHDECVQVIKRCETVGLHLPSNELSPRVIDEQLRAIIQVRAFNLWGHARGCDLYEPQAGYPHFEGFHFRSLKGQFYSIGVASIVVFTLTGGIELARIFDALAATPARTMVWTDISEHLECPCVKIGLEFDDNVVAFRVWTNLMQSGIARSLACLLVLRGMC